ncbi:MAG: DUF3291 domain-containing protein [Thermomicrobiales bacterium]
MPRVAFVTFGILREAGGHPQVQGFYDRNMAVFAASGSSHGHIGHHGDAHVDLRSYNVGVEGDRFGAYSTGRFVTPEFAGREAQTLSVWTDLDAVFAFAYGALHLEALRLRTDWFLRPDWPTYAAWWVADDHWPDWREANARLEHLHDHDHGASAFAFDFRSPYDPDGRSTRLDRRRVAESRPRPEGVEDGMPSERQESDSPAEQTANC